MSGRRSRNKGANFEREVANLLKPVYETAKRGIGQARSAGEVADVEGTPFWVECKRHKRCNIQKAYEQAAGDTDGRPLLIVTKDDTKPILVTMTLETFLQWVGGQTSTTTCSKDCQNKKP